MSDATSNPDGPPPEDVLRFGPSTQRLPATGGGPDWSDPDPGLSREDLGLIDALRPGTALLIVQHGANAGARFLLDNAEVTSGRGPDSDIFLDDVTVSRKHAVFSWEDDRFVIRDVGSLNGTYVNRQRVDEVALQDHDEVQIGKFRLVFRQARG
ncbi:FHA domain-containing protein [Nostocoides vanveenii]|uniref:FHA domain-containing protein n=1 Tax=Nostocoides vanveenii TaxID=330835 RepID=A0ABN2KF58_9MICO